MFGKTTPLKLPIAFLGVVSSAISTGPAPLAGYGLLIREELLGPRAAPVWAFWPPLLLTYAEEPPAEGLTSGLPSI